MSIWNSQWSVDCIGADYETVIQDGIDVATAVSWNDYIRILIPMQDPKMGVNEVLVTAQQAANLIDRLIRAVAYIESDNKAWPKS